MEKEASERKKRVEVLKDIAGKFEDELEKKAPEKHKLTRIFNELYFIATRDKLTGVYNRRALDETLGHEMLRAIRNQSPISVMMLDIDNFKHYNDTFGHQQGDEALRAVTRVIQRHTRKVDFAARYGGEEFIIVLPDTKIKGAVEVAERIRSDIAKAKIRPVSKDIPAGYEKVTISIGIAGADSWEKDGFEITHRADIALYEAKRTGKNKIEIFNG